MRLIIQLAGAALAVAMAAGTANAQVVVSSKIDTEGGLLGNVISQVLQANGVPVTEKIQLGATSVVRDAIIAGQIDIYPEYTGNGAFFFNKADDPLWNDAAKAYAEVAKLDLDANKIVWLAPAPANNTWAVARAQGPRRRQQARDLLRFRQIRRRRRRGEARGLRRVRQLAGGAAEVRDRLWLHAQARAAGDAFGRRYGGYDRRSGATRPTASTPRWSMAPMAASRRPASWCSPTTRACSRSTSRPPIIREAVLQQYPQIKDLLAPVFAKLDLATLQKLNGRIQVGGEAAKAVAADWLKTERLPEVMC